MSTTTSERAVVNGVKSSCSSAANGATPPRAKRSPCAVVDAVLERWFTPAFRTSRLDVVD